jgi:hypothetical protein
MHRIPPGNRKSVFYLPVEGAVKIIIGEVSCTSEGPAKGPGAWLGNLGLPQKEIRSGELMDSGADGSPKWRKPVGHGIRAKDESRPLYITSYCDRVSSMGAKGIKNQAQWSGGARQREMDLEKWGK